VGRAGTLATVGGEKVGSFIGAAFGLLFVLLNTGSLPGNLALALRTLAAMAFVAVVVRAVGRRPHRTARTPATAGFTRGYWLVVAGEALTLAIGLALINGPLGVPRAAVAWVSLVVGLHFVALALVRGLRLFHAVGGALSLCGLLGLVLAGADSSAELIDGVAGVLPGAILLGSGLWGATGVAATRPVHL
jgi:hypothetical protein